MTNERPSVEKLFEEVPTENVGHKRKVLSAQLTNEGEEHTFFVKEKQSHEEIEIHRYLNGLDISEKLVTYDDEKLVFEKSSGIDFSEYVHSLITQRPDKIHEIETLNRENPRFKMKSLESYTLPEEVATTDPKVRGFISEYVAELLFLLLSGIFHNDIKTDNLLVDEDGHVHFIDFGEAQIMSKNHLLTDVLPLYFHDLADGMKLLESIYPPFSTIVKNLCTHAEDKCVLPPFSREVMTMYQEENVTLSERPIILLQQLKDVRGEISGDMLSNDLVSIGLPESLAHEIGEKFASIVIRKQSN